MQKYKITKNKIKLSPNSTRPRPSRQAFFQKSFTFYLVDLSCLEWRRDFSREFQLA